MMKKAKKLGIDDQYKTIFFEQLCCHDDYEIDINDSYGPDSIESKLLKAKCNKGKFIIMYYPNNKNNEISVYEGEEDELTQINRIKRSPQS